MARPIYVSRYRPLSDMVQEDELQTRPGQWPDKLLGGGWLLTALFAEAIVLSLFDGLRIRDRLGLFLIVGLATLSLWLWRRHQRDQRCIQKRRSDVTPKATDEDLTEVELSILCFVVEKNELGVSHRDLRERFQLSRDDVEEALERLIELKLIAVRRFGQPGE